MTKTIGKYIILSFLFSIIVLLYYSLAFGEYEEIIKKYANMYDFDYNFISKVIMVESSFNPGAVSWTNCRGLMQISQYALVDYNRINKTNYSIEDLFIPEINIKIGCWYLSYLRSILKSKEVFSYGKLLASYNFGIGNVVRGKKYPRETRLYINKILRK